MAVRIYEVRSARQWQGCDKTALTLNFAESLDRIEVMRIRNKASIAAYCALLIPLAVLTQTPALGQPMGQPQFNSQPPAYGASYPQNFQQQGAPQMQQPPMQQPMQMQSQMQQTNPNDLRRWFGRYDQVRRDAQMTPQERKKADGLMSKGLSIFVPGEEKVSTQALLSKLVAKYNTACEQMKQLELYPETKQLHLGYYRYFNDARGLFSDYIKVQENPLVKDQNGAVLAGGLLQRKQNLEFLDQNNKALDGQLRNQLGVAPYQY